MHIKDGFEMFIEVFDGNRADFVQNLAEFHARILMRIGVVLSGEVGNLGTAPVVTLLGERFLIMIMLITQQEV
jgi:hypothetical protein